MRSARPLAASILALSLAGLFAGGFALDVLRGADPWPGARGRGPHVCSFRLQTGRPCLGCGGTRALRKMSQGDWRGALAANPLGAFAGLAAWLVAAGALGSTVTGRSSLVKISLGITAALTPAAFVWNGLSWWLWFWSGP